MKKVWQMNRSAKGLLIETTKLDGFSLVNHRQFAKLSTHQTFYPPNFPAMQYVDFDLNCYLVLLKVLSQAGVMSQYGNTPLMANTLVQWGYWMVLVMAN